MTSIPIILLESTKLRGGGLVISALDYGSSGPGSNSD